MSRSNLVARNVLATLLTQFASLGLSFAVTLYLPRYLGVTGLGQLGFASALVMVLSVFVSLGTSTVLVKEIARDRERTGELIVAAFLLRLGTGALVTVAAVGALTLLHYPLIIRLLVLASALGMVAATLNDVFCSALVGQEKLPRQSLALLVEKCCSSLLTVLMIFCHAPIWIIAGVGICSNAVSLAVNLYTFRHLKWPLRLPSPAILRTVTIAGLPFIGYMVFRYLYGCTDPVVLKAVTNDATVGWYSAVSRLLGVTLIIPGALCTAVFPLQVRLFKEDREQFKQLSRKAFSLLMLCAIPVAMVLLCMPEQLITLMHYPKEFIACTPVLRLSSAAVLLYYAGCILGNMVTATDQQAKLARTSIYACCIGIPACIAGSYLGHRYWGNGAVGAMLSDIALETYLVVVYVRMLPRGTFDLSTLSLVSRYIVAGLPAAGGLVLATRSPAGLWSILPLTALYLALCWLLRCLDPGYLALLRGAVARKMEA